MLAKIKKRIRPAQYEALFAGDAVLAAAVLDRLLHHADAINISGRSYRLKDKEVMFKE